MQHRLGSRTTTGRAEPAPRAGAAPPRRPGDGARGQPARRTPPPRPPALPSIGLFGVDLHAVTADQAVAHVIAELDAGRGGWVLTPNLDILRRLVHDRAFARLCRGATLRLADGMPLVWAARLQGTPLPERVAGSDLIWSLTAAAARAGRSVYFLGGNQGAAEGAAATLRRLNPALRVAGVDCPPPGFERDPAQVARRRRRLVAARPDIVYVALGSPKQEQLISTLREDLPKSWFLGIGISLSFVAGEVRRAPPVVRRLGLEWLHRLAQEPRRLARRYLVDGPPFAALLLSRALAQRVRAPGPVGK